MPELPPLPPVLAGPMLRRMEPGRLVLWLVASRKLPLVLRLNIPRAASRDIGLDTHCRIIPVGRHAFIYLIDVPLSDPLPEDVSIGYDLLTDEGGIAQWAPIFCTQAPHCPISYCTGAFTNWSMAPAANPTTLPMKVCCASTACWLRHTHRPNARHC